MTTPHPVEIELKLALPPQQVEAFLKRMARRRSAPVQQELITRYFDTPDFALSEQGVALRVRRVGRRWLQTLKTEGERHGGLSQRAEYEMAIARSTPDWTRFPAEALAWVPDALRAQLVPVFETRFRRTAWLLKGKGGAQIEVALDVGEVRAGERRQPICEIELELKSGQPDALFALALDWAQQLDCVPLDVSKAERGVRLAHGEGAAPVKSVPLVLDRAMSVEDGFAAICQACLAQFQANLPGVLTSDDIEYVHQARVALRRLRAALRLTRRVCGLPDELMDGLRTLAAALGTARDWDVLCGETLPAIAPHYPNNDSWQHGMHALEAHRAEVRAAMQAAMTQAHPGAWLLALQRWLLQRGWRLCPSGYAVPEAQRFIQLSPLNKWARQALQKGHRPIVRGARDFAQLQPLQRHALRIAIKRQRYAAEFFQTLFSERRQARYQTVLRNAQDSLGRANDAHIAWGLLTAAHTTPHVLQNVVDRSPLGQADTGPMGDFVLGWLAAKQVEAADEDSVRHLQDFMKLKPYW
ncbi:MAG TPA: CHAD domain-containing protein [Thiobacillus sp.]|nr:CHAD domain-containing protein [Thiobacillus sp.]